MVFEVGIVIPYYHEDLTDIEKIALEQCLKILGRYPIIFVVPDSMAEKNYPAIPGVVYERVPKEWLLSVRTYNQMMLNINFYKRFVSYKYILIYQLDAFVFNDQLLEMCQYDYDYIGAPWLSGYFYFLNTNKCIWRVGNGGFSLRKVESIIRLLKKMPDDFIANEDLFYAISDGNSFKVAPLEIALKFSFETEVRECFELNDRVIPFGCHAWEKYDFDFWKPYIEGYGYKLKLKKDYLNKDFLLGDEYAKQKEIASYWEKEFSAKKLKEDLKKMFSKNVSNYIVWGVGRYGKELIKIFDDIKLPIKFLVDNNRKLVGKKFLEYEIKSIDEIFMSTYDAVIVAIKNIDEEGIKPLKQHGKIRGKDYILLEDLLTILKI